MTCLTCGASMETQRQNYRYDASGLAVTLIDVEVSRCSRCGEREVSIPRIEDLHRAIAHEVICKTARLAPHEIRFLRKYLGWSASAFARRMGVEPATVSRWETGAKPIGSIADRLVRLMVAHMQPTADYSLEILGQVQDEQDVPVRLDLEADAQGWHRTPRNAGAVSEQAKEL